ncbi:MAG: YncE family protein [Candidatus Limnocylindria bacterium]
MSSELHKAFRADLDQIPLRPEDEWVPSISPPRAPASRRQVSRGLVPGGLLVVLLVIASVVAGLVLSDVRRALRTDVASPSADAPAVIEGRDLVHLAEGEEGSRALVSVAMPDGRVTGRLPGEAYIGPQYAGSPIVTGRELAFVPTVGPPLTLRGVDLRTGSPATEIEAEPLGLGTAESRCGAGTGPEPFDVATSQNGSSVFLVRNAGTNGTVTVLERYDARSGAVLARREWRTTAAEVQVRTRLVPFDDEHIAVVRELMSGCAPIQPIQQEWRFLASDLAEIGSVTIDVRERDTCRLELIPVTSTREWLLVCSDPFGFVPTRLVFLDQGFREKARVELSRQLGLALGAVLMSDGNVAVITERPLVVRVDPRTYEVIDKRPVVGGRSSLLDLVAPPVAAAKEIGGRSIAFSPDGNFVYLPRASAAWIDGVALIDLRDAAVVAQSDRSGRIALSSDGGRLYVLSGSGPATRLILLDPGTLREIATSEPLTSGPFSIVAVASP